jgi:hypothetical protein
LWLNSCGYPGRILFSTFSSSGEVRLKYLLYLQSFVFPFPPCPSHVDSGAFTFQCGVALWLVDLASKNFIADCWRQRGRFLSGLASFDSVQLNITVPTKKAVQVWAPNTRSAKWSKEARGHHRSNRAAFLYCC